METRPQGHFGHLKVGQVEQSLRALHAGRFGYLHGGRVEVTAE
jgi:hypothetical protein